MPFVQQRRGTKAQLEAANEIPLDGQLIIEEQSDGFQKIKIGDGVTHYNALEYVTQKLSDLNDVDAFVSPTGPDSQILVRNNGSHFTETYVPYAAIGSIPLGNYPAGSLGEKINTKVDNTDARLTDERVPTDDSVSTAKIANDAITSAKIATDAVVSDKIVANAVGTSKIADNAVTFAKIQDVSANSLLGAASAGGVTQIVCRQIGRDILDDSTAADVRTTISAVDQAAVDTSITNAVAGTANIADDAVTYPKMQDTTAGGVVLGKTGNYQEGVGGGQIQEIALSNFARTYINQTSAAGVKSVLGYVEQTEIDTAIANLVDSAPGALDTLNELAGAINNDVGFHTTITDLITTANNNIATNTSSISSNAADITTNTANIATNASGIATNTTSIATNATSASNALTTAQSGLAMAATNQGNVTTNTTNIATNTANVATNTSNIATNTSSIATNTSNISTNSTNASNALTTANAGLAMAATNQGNITTNTSNISTNVTNIAAKLPLAGGTMTGALLADYGTTSAPGLSFAGDTNTGFKGYSDKIHVICGGTRQIFIEDDQCQFHQEVLADEVINTKKGFISGNNQVGGFYTLVTDNYHFMSRAYLATNNNNTFCFHARMQDAIGGHTSTGEWVAFNADLAYDGGGTRAKHIGFKANDSLKGVGTLTAGFYSDMSDASVWQLYMVGTAPSRFAGQVQYANGSASAPSVSFNANTNTGMYYDSGLALGFAGTAKITIAAQATTFTNQTRIPDGTASSPSLCFTSDTDTGLSYTSNNLNLVYGGANRISIGGGGVTIGNVTTTLNGAVAITQGLPLSEIAQGGATSGQTLQWNGSTWSPTTPSGGGGGASSLNGLNDVTITGTPSDNSLLRYDSGNSVFENYNPDSFSSSSGGGVVINLADGNKIHNWTCASSGVQSVILMGVPSTSGVSCSFTLVIEYPGSGTTTAIVQWPSSFKWPGGVAPTLTNTGGKQDTFTFLSLDNGSTWLAHVGGQNF